MSIVHIGVTLDCTDPQLLSAFWSQALGLDAEAEGEYVMLRGRGERSGLDGFTLQRVPESKMVKNRMHFDVVVSGVVTEVARLERLGATVVSREAESTPYETVVMSDPERNEFCVIKERSSD